MSTVRTFGHGTLAADDLASLLHDTGIELVVDVRRYPGSRRHPHLSREAMEGWLPGAGIGYRWLEALGGRRRPSPSSPNVAWRNDQFRAYADHMATPEFLAGLEALLDLPGDGGVAVMCSESVWWRCHRRLIADHLVLLDGVEVEHLFHDGRRQPHPPNPAARRAGDHLVYDVGVDRPLTGT